MFSKMIVTFLPGISSNNPSILDCSGQYSRAEAVPKHIKNRNSFFHRLCVCSSTSMIKFQQQYGILDSYFTCFVLSATLLQNAIQTFESTSYLCWLWLWQDSKLHYSIFIFSEVFYFFQDYCVYFNSLL